MKSQIAAVAIAITSLAIISGAHLWQRSKPDVPSFQQVRSSYRSSDRLVLDRFGELLDEVRVDQRGRRLDWAFIEDISPALIEAVIRSEDRGFRTHAGVDYRALASASWNNIFTHHRRGASTITMQLAALLENRPEMQSGRRTWIEKLQQVRLARAIEEKWSKAEILETYLNRVHFRGELQGIGAASRILFRRDPHGLNVAESAILAALLRAPNATWDQVQTRAKLLGNEQEVAAEIELARKHDMTDHGIAKIAPQFAHRLIANTNLQNTNNWIDSTLDAGLQREAVRLATEQLTLLSSQNVHDVGILVVENQTGQVLAYVGNIAELSSARFNDGVQTRRQAGSILKPFLYAAAFEHHILTPHSLLADSPLEVDTGRGLYRPQNYDQNFHGVVDVRTALASSMNVPAVRTLKLLTPDAFVDTLNELGFSQLNSGSDYGVSLALGTADINLWELTRAYRTFAMRGFYSDLVEIKSNERKSAATSSKRIFSPATSYQIADILSDREARSLTFGLENPLATRFWTAVKTGTSKGMRDNWCVGFSSRYTVGVWVGNFNGDAMWDVSGISGAAPIWVGLMNYLHADQPSLAPVRPVELASDEKVEAIGNRGFQKIILPSSGTVMAWDPDIPQSRQKILFESTAHEGKYRWLLNGKLIGRADHPYLWEPKPGRHRLQIVGPNGSSEDQVTFTVK